MLTVLKSLRLYPGAMEGSDTAVKLGNGLKLNSTIQCLSLCCRVESSRLWDPVVSALAERSACLEKLSLSSENHSFQSRSEDWASPVTCVTHLIKAGKSPKELHLTNVWANDNEWAQFGSSLETPSCGLVELSIANVNLQQAGVLAIGQALKLNTIIKRLKLCRNNLGDDGLGILARGLSFNTTIASLQLANNQISDDGISNFTRHWSLDSAISNLDLTSNDIGPVGVQQLLKAITGHTAMEKLTLVENPLIGLSEVKKIGELLSTLKLKTLDINSSPSWAWTTRSRSDVSLGSSTRNLKEETGLALAQGMASNFYMHELSVSCLDIPARHKRRICFYTDLNKQGRHLLAQDNDIPPMIWCRVLGNCEKSALYYFLLQKPDLFSNTWKPPTSNSISPHFVNL